MKIKVTKNECLLEEENIVNKGEYNVTEVEFEFSEEYTNDLVKKAIFATELGTYEKVIINNKCTIPEEVLQQKGYVVIGVYAFKVENETLDLRYSPKPFSKFIEDGSYTSNIINSEELTPTDKEQMEQAIQEMEAKVDNLDIDAEKNESTTTITITKKDGTTKEVEILDGIGLNYNWQGTSLGIKREDEQTYEYVNLKGDTGEPGQIEFIVVSELPQTGIEGTIYLVPLTTPDMQENNYAEYIWVNNSWELLGKIGVHVDLTNYYTKQETNTLLSGKQSTIDNSNKLSSDLVDDTNKTNKFVTDAEKTTWNNKYTKASTGIPKTDLDSSVQTSLGKADTAIQQHQDISGKEDKSNKVTSISSQSTDTQYPSALAVYNYIDGIVGDISSIIDDINGEVI
jgi:hypothetical protein